MSLHGYLAHEHKLLTLRSSVRADARTSVGNRQTIVFALHHAVELTRALPRARGVDGIPENLLPALNLAQQFAEGNDPVQESCRARHVARLVAAARAQSSPRDRAFGPQRLNARNLDRVLDVAYLRALALARNCDDLGPVTPTVTGAPSFTEPASMALHMAQRIARILPPIAQPRYDEEFRSELHELAAAGASRWVQLQYVLRLFDRAWVLRAELREAARKRVVS
jgi:hypothetical protein